MKMKLLYKKKIKKYNKIQKISLNNRFNKIFIKEEYKINNKGSFRMKKQFVKNVKFFDF